VWRFQSVYKTSLEKFKSVVIDHEVLLKRDNRIEIGKEIKKEKSRSDRHYYYVRSSASFPVTSRDFVLVRHDEWKAKEGIYFVYSIEDEEFPPFPKTVRGQILNTFCQVVANETDTEVTFTYTGK
jgi:hypothetical protein